MGVDTITGMGDTETGRMGVWRAVLLVQLVVDAVVLYCPFDQKR